MVLPPGAGYHRYGDLNNWILKGVLLCNYKVFNKPSFTSLSRKNEGIAKKFSPKSTVINLLAFSSHHLFLFTLIAKQGICKP